MNKYLGRYLGTGKAATGTEIKVSRLGKGLPK